MRADARHFRSRIRYCLGISARHRYIQRQSGVVRRLPSSPETNRSVCDRKYRSHSPVDLLQTAPSSLSPSLVSAWRLLRSMSKSSAARATAEVLGLDFGVPVVRPNRLRRAAGIKYCLGGKPVAASPPIAEEDGNKVVRAWCRRRKRRSLCPVIPSFSPTVSRSSTACPSVFTLPDRSIAKGRARALGSPPGLPPGQKSTKVINEKSRITTG